MKKEKEILSKSMQSLTSNMQAMANNMADMNRVLTKVALEIESITEMPHNRRGERVWCSEEDYKKIEKKEYLSGICSSIYFVGELISIEEVESKLHLEIEWVLMLELYGKLSIYAKHPVTGCLLIAYNLYKKLKKNIYYDDNDVYFWDVKEGRSLDMSVELFKSFFLVEIKEKGEKSYKWNFNNFYVEKVKFIEIMELIRNI